MAGKRPTITITNVTTDSATINIVKNDATQIHVVVREMYGSETIIFDSGTISLNIQTTTATLTLPNLSPGTVYAYNLWDNVSNTWVGLKTFTTQSLTNKPSAGRDVLFNDRDEHSVNVVLKSISGADLFRVKYWEAGKDESQAEYSDWYIRRTFIVDGLRPNTTYHFRSQGKNDDGEGAESPDYYSYTTPEKIFTPFDWTYAGLSESGSLVYGSTKRAGLGMYVTAAEWNELAALVEDVTGNSVTHVSSGATISAATVNTMASVLGVSRVSVGDEITAGFFNRLRSAYNGLE